MATLLTVNEVHIRVSSVSLRERLVPTPLTWQCHRGQPFVPCHTNHCVVREMLIFKKNNCIFFLAFSLAIFASCFIHTCPSHLPFFMNVAVVPPVLFTRALAIFFSLWFLLYLCSWFLWRLMIVLGQNTLKTFIRYLVWKAWVFCWYIPAFEYC